MLTQFRNRDLQNLVRSLIELQAVCRIKYAFRSILLASLVGKRINVKAEQCQITVRLRPQYSISLYT